jgi:hypothetical protein
VLRHQGVDDLEKGARAMLAGGIASRKIDCRF